MSNMFKIFIAVFLAIIAANFFNSAMFRLWYPSETELAIQESQKYLDNYNKANAERVKATIQQIEKERSEYIDNTMNQRFNASNQNRNVFFSNQTNSDNNAYVDNSKYAQQLKLLEKENKKRRNAENERLRAQSKENEARRKRHENKMADLQHIRSENMKTCKYWTAEYERNPAAQNKIYKKTSCDRAYGR